MVIAVGCDHAGFILKKMVSEQLQAAGYIVMDLGTDSTVSVDYPDYAHAVAKAVSSGKAEKGIAICGSGIGMSIAANKVRGIRAALCATTEQAKLSRAHNDANVLALGARLTSPEDIRAIIEVWLNTPFEGGRHQRRIDKIEI
ncbi:MAG: ribose 5-phosphate isomerase B [FCB group bacterium]|nr:ribose 5-phosphate isomerase B [FCB group bacterium]